uniref:nicotianamine aminotransferase n=1 Tax=Anthurium amnicola TaxID=1678845 RepID=A0A1D1YIK5_9ARAE
MENGAGQWRRCGFAPNPALMDASNRTIRGVLDLVISHLDPVDTRPVIPLGHGDPSAFPCFRTSPAAEDAVVAALRSGNYNSYSPSVGLAPARRAVAEYLSRDLPYELSPDDIFLTAGCNQSIEAVLSVFAGPGANILLPRPGYPYYEAWATFRGLEIRHFDLLPDKGWEVDLDAVEALADDNTVAMLVVNPGNPTGSVLSYEHLSKVAETARRLGIMVIADEVYGRLTFGSNPFVPMGAFASIAPILTLGSISKRWVVPGWRLGWIVTNDTNGVLKEMQIVKGIQGYLNMSADPTTFIQGAIPQIIENTKEDFYNKTISLLRQTAEICYTKIKEIDSIACPHKPEGSMFVMVKLNVSHLENICDDIDFCCKLAKEKSVIILPGSVIGLDNWLRVTFAIDPSSLEEGLHRLKSFCQKHAKQAQ